MPFAWCPAQTHASCLHPPRCHPEAPDLYRFLDTPDQEQLAAIRAPAGPVRVLAPAGSGKTRVLANRVLELLNRGAAPAAVLALAFNTQAAAELRARLVRAGVPVAARLHDRGVAVRTLHALGHEIVRRAYGYRFSQAGARLTARLAWRAVRQTGGLPPGACLPDAAAAAVLEQATRIKEQLLPPDGQTLHVDGLRIPLGPVFRRLEADLHGARCYGSFADMIYWALQALLERPALREELQSRFVWVLVDEYQDLNGCQVRFTELLAAPQGNLYVVGDDDQMIYGWRGADAMHLLGFSGLHPAARTFALTTNYRSAGSIVAHSQRLIARNQRRFPKTIRPATDAPRGGVHLAVAASLDGQAELAAAWMHERRTRAGCAWTDFAVLTRYRSDHHVLAPALAARGVPHTRSEPAALFLTAPGRVLQAYLTVLLQPLAAGPQCWRLALRTFAPSLPPAALNSVCGLDGLNAATRQGRLAARHQRRLKSFAAAAAAFRTRLAGRRDAPRELVEQLLREFGILEHFAVHAGRTAGGATLRSDRGSDAMICAALPAVAAGYASLEALLAAARSQAAPTPPAGVAISTMHATKGRQYPFVVLFNVAADLRAGGADTEEERRVHYVGATRPQRELLVTCPPFPACSRFVLELFLDPQLGLCRGSQLRRAAGVRGPGPRQWWRGWPWRQPGISAASAQASCQELRWRTALGLPDNVRSALPDG